MQNLIVFVTILSISACKVIKGQANLTDKKNDDSKTYFCVGFTSTMGTKPASEYTHAGLVAIDAGALSVENKLMYLNTYIGNEYRQMRIGESECKPLSSQELNFYTENCGLRAQKQLTYVWTFTTSSSIPGERPIPPKSFGLDAAALFPSADKANLRDCEKKFWQEVYSTEPGKSYAAGKSPNLLAPKVK